MRWVGAVVLLSPWIKITRMVPAPMELKVVVSRVVQPLEHPDGDDDKNGHAQYRPENVESKRGLSERK